MFPFESMGVVFLRVSGAITFEYWLKWVKWIDFSNQKLTRNYSSNASNSVLSSQSIIFLLFIPPRAHQTNINCLNLLIIFRMLPISICYDLSPEAFILLFRTFFFFFFLFHFLEKGQEKPQFLQEEPQPSIPSLNTHLTLQKGVGLIFPVAYKGIFNNLDQ